MHNIRRSITDRTPLCVSSISSMVRDAYLTVLLVTHDLIHCNLFIIYHFY